MTDGKKKKSDSDEDALQASEAAEAGQPHTSQPDESKVEDAQFEDLGATEPAREPGAEDSADAAWKDDWNETSAKEEDSPGAEEVTRTDAEAKDFRDGDLDDESLMGEKPVYADESETAQAEAAPVAASPEVPLVADAPAATEIIRETVVEKRGGFVPGLVGGLVGGLAFVFGAPYVLPRDWLPPANTAALEQRIDAGMEETRTALGEVRDSAAKTEDLSALSGEIASLSEPLSGLQDSQTDLTARIEGVQSAMADISGDLGELAPRIDALERRPIAESPDPTAVAAVQSYGREVEALRADVAAQMKQAEDILQEAIRQASAAREEAAALAAEAEERARQTALQQAVVDVQAAIEAGEPFADALSRLGDTPVPDALQAVAADGVATLASLQDAFPDLAREALATSRETLAGDAPADRGRAFLERQLGLRSLAPREGDSPDAVLSRAEAAVREARLTDAVAEVAALPENARNVMNEWVARAEARAAAVAAADELAAGLTPN